MAVRTGPGKSGKTERAACSMLHLIPDFAESKQPCFLFLGAHSDDIEIGCGATVLTLANNYPSASVHWVVFSATAARQAEACNSANDFLTGFRDPIVETHTFRNAYFPLEAAGIKDTFEELKKRVSPDLVFTHHKDDRHQDHRLIGELTWNTFRDSMILEYEIPKYDGGLGDPNLFVDAADSAREAKLDKILEHFPSQSGKHWFTRDLFLALMRLRGVEGNTANGFAEAFYCRKASLGFRSNDDRK